MKIKVKNKVVGLIGTALFAVVMVSPAQAGLIDGFGDSTPTPAEVNSGQVFDSVTTLNLTDSTVAGIDRLIELTANGVPSGFNDAVAGTAGGEFVFSNSTLVGATAEITYSDFLLDLTSTVLGLEILANDTGFTYEVSASDGVVTSSKSQGVAAGVLGSLNVAFNGLLPNTIDLSMVNWLKVSFDANEALDLRADFLADVPEPGMLTLLGIGLLGLGLSSRRKKIAA